MLIYPITFKIIKKKIVIYFKTLSTYYESIFTVLQYLQKDVIAFELIYKLI